MPTVGWIREGDWDAFLEGTERLADPGPPPPPLFQCPFCDFTSRELPALKAHISADHAVARPVLLIGGSEPGPATVLRKSAKRLHFEVANATNVEFALDGRGTTPIRPTELSRRLEGLTHSDVSIVLWNASQPRAAPVSTRYKLAFRVADPNSLRQVEIAFSEELISTSLSRSSITRFLEDSRCRGAAGDYAQGLANFVLGVLLKERPSAEHLTTPFARYRESYSSALRVLSEIQRPFARLVSAVIRFALNDFSQASRPSSYWELDVATALLANAEIADLPQHDPATRRRAVCPIDHGTGLIIDLAVRLSRLDRWSPILDEQCRQMANSSLFDAMDRQKTLAIWGICAWRLGATEHAIEPLREIAATYPFRSWVEPYLEGIIK